MSILTGLHFALLSVDVILSQAWVAANAPFTRTHVWWDVSWWQDMEKFSFGSTALCIVSTLPPWPHLLNGVMLKTLTNQSERMPASSCAMG